MIMTHYELQIKRLLLTMLVVKYHITVSVQKLSCMKREYSVSATILHFHVITQFSSHNKFYSVSNGLGSNATGTISVSLNYNTM